MTPSDALRIVGLLSASYPAARIEPATTELYALMLSDLDYERVRSVVIDLVAESKWLPTIAEIRTRAVECSDRPPAELAWSEVLDAVRRHGIYAQPCFANPCTAIAVRAVGWREICNSTTPGVEREHFRRAYQHALERDTRERNAGHLREHLERQQLAGEAPLLSLLRASNERGEDE